jgi:dimethylargininase
VATLALVREVPASLPRALTGTPPDPPIDVARARVQHAAYVEALVAIGLDILRLPADDDFPDCPFVEDVAVVAGGIALVTRPGAPSRRGETPPVATALAEQAAVRLERMEAPATLDGGDVLQLGDVFYVGASARSNAEGAARLGEAFGARVVRVALPPGVLHLKSVCSPLAADVVLLAEGTIPPATFAGARVVVVPRAELAGANAVANGRAAIVAAGFPRTRELVEAAGFRTVAVDNSELRKADSALTCLSILV